MRVYPHKHQPLHDVVGQSREKSDTWRLKTWILLKQFLFGFLAFSFFVLFIREIPGFIRLVTSSDELKVHHERLLDHERNVQWR
jgi:hypothetical protein